MGLLADCLWVDLVIWGCDGHADATAEASEMAVAADPSARYLDPARLFGPELVLYATLAPEDPAQFPWRVHATLT